MASKTPLTKTSASLFDSPVIESTVVTDVSRADEIQTGKRLSAWAVLSLVMGVVGFLSLVWIAFVVFSLFAAICAAIAFVLMTRSGDELAGKKLAFIGMVLGCASGVAGPVNAAVYEHEFSKQAELFCRCWFEAAASDNPALAFLMTDYYWQRPVFDTHQKVVEFWRRKLRGDESEHYGAHTFLSNPTLLTLQATRDRAKISYHSTVETLITNSTEQTNRVYAVTIPPETPEGKTQTFFLSLIVERSARKTPQGERLVGWTWHSSDLIPLKIDAAGRPITEDL